MNNENRLDAKGEYDDSGPAPRLDIDAVRDVFSLNLFAFEACETMFAEESTSSIYWKEIRAGMSLYLSSLRERNCALKSIRLADTDSKPGITNQNDYLCRIAEEFQRLIETLHYLNINLLTYTGTSIADDCHSLGIAVCYYQDYNEFLERSLPELGKNVCRVFHLHLDGHSITDIAAQCAMPEKQVERHLQKAFTHFYFKHEQTLNGS